MASKLARQMAYKKKLEEVFRLAEGRRKLERKSRYSGYQVCAYETWEWGEVGRVQNQNIADTCTVKQNKHRDVENEQELENSL